MTFGLRRAKMLDPMTALCTIVHRAVKVDICSELMANDRLKRKSD